MRGEGRRTKESTGREVRRGREEREEREGGEGGRRRRRGREEREEREGGEGGRRGRRGTEEREEKDKQYKVHTHMYKGSKQCLTSGCLWQQVAAACTLRWTTTRQLA